MRKVPKNFQMYQCEAVYEVQEDGLQITCRRVAKGDVQDGIPKSLEFFLRWVFVALCVA